MFIPLFFIFSLIISSISNGVIVKTSNDLNTSITWSRVYGRFIFNERGGSITETSDGGYIVVGTTYRSFQATGMWIMKLDGNGLVKWRRIIRGFSLIGKHVEETSDGNYIVAGEDAYSILLLKIGVHGRIIWSRSFEEDVYIWRQRDRMIQQTSDGGYIIVGGTGRVDPQVWLIKTDGYGRMVWNKTYGLSGSIDYGTSVYQTSDGGYIIAGSSNADSLLLIKTDSNGEEEWMKVIEEDCTIDVSSIQQTSDGGYIVSGGRSEGWLIKFNESGDIEWEIAIEHCLILHSVEETSDGGFIATGTSSAAAVYPGDLYLLKVSNDGEVEWLRKYGREDYYEIGYCVRETSDGGYIIAGSKQLILPRTIDIFLDIWVLKTDENGVL